MAGRNVAAGVGSLLPRRRRLSPPCAGDRRPSDPALGIPDQLHALPAGDLAGHAAGPVRIPDPGRGADRHGGRQRLDVRRLDRLRRGGADGPSRDAPAQGGAVGRPASAIRRRRRARLGAMANDEVVRLPLDPRAARGHRGAIDDETSPASSSRRPTSSAICATSRRSPTPPTPRARCWSPSSPKRCRSAWCARPARWAPTSSSARASRSATR